jgi:hypothetical protein
MTNRLRLATAWQANEELVLIIVIESEIRRSRFKC